MPDELHLPRARKQAAKLAQQLKSMVNSPSAEVAVVSDTGAHLASGYVVATTKHGPVRVVGVPFNTLVPGMRIFVAPIALGQYVYQAMAPSPAIYTNSSHAVLADSGALAAAASVDLLSTGGAVGADLMTLPGGLPNQGWYWSFFFYVPSLPPPTTSWVLWEQALVVSSSVTGYMQITYDANGWLRQTFYNWPLYYSPYTAGQTFQTSSTQYSFAPHNVWFVTLQVASGFTVNGIQPPGSAAPSLGSITGNTMQTGDYWHYFLGSHTNSQCAPAGSWISKMSFGNAAVSNVEFNPFGATIPAADSDIVNGTATLNAGTRTYGRWLISDYATYVTGGGGSDIYYPNSASAGGTVRLHRGQDTLYYGPY